MKIQLFAVAHSRNIGDENIGISRIASFLRKQEVSAELQYLYYNNDINGEFDKIDLECELYGFSAYSPYLDFIFEIAKKIKEKKPAALVCLGSRFASDAADLILDECKSIDFIILGHGEFPLYDVIQGLEDNKSIDEIVQKNNHIKTKKDRVGKVVCNTDINLLTWPDREYIKTNNKMYANIGTSHGCMANCTFCSVTEKRLKWSGRNIDDIMNEIIDIYNKTGIRCYSFNDGTFEDPGEKGKERVKGLCLRLIDYPIKFAFRCWSRAESFKNNERDREILTLMKKAGFSNVFIGIESGNEEDLLIYNKRATLRDNENALELFNNHGIDLLYGFIFLNPYSDEMRLEDNYKFLLKYKSHQLDHYTKCLQIHYNTPIYHRLKMDNLLRDDYTYKGSTYEYKCSNRFVEEVFEFLREYFDGTSQLCRLDFEYHSFTHFYNFMNTLLEDINDIQEIVMKLRTDIFEQHKSYFANLYINRDIQQCIRLFPDFEKDIISLYKKADMIKQMLVKKYIKQFEYNPAVKVSI